jgi:phosphopantetheinyl transferase
MPVFFQHQINDTTRIGVWKIEETEEFFKSNVPQHRDVTHPHKRLQHLAGRFLLQFLFADFPYELIRIADTRKPFLPNEEYHFSISHCSDFAAAIVSRHTRVGIDIERPVEKINNVRHKFLNGAEMSHFDSDNIQSLTLCWSVKEAVFKWFGYGSVDFKEHIHITGHDATTNQVDCFFKKTQQPLVATYREFPGLTLVWVTS